ncbi:MAG: prepilin-type N-terminal cleavage/methylation domain-containing protein [Candidatus Hinthialibacter sp.]
MKSCSHSSRAFTLIELLIVVAIIGILAAIAVPNFLNAQTRAKVARTWADLKTLINALEQYRLDNNAYVPDFDGIGLGGPSEINTYRALTTPMAYLSTIPLDIWISRRQEAAGILRGKNERYFEYWGAGYGVTTRADMIQYGIGYALRSVGPDKEETWMGDYHALGQKTGQFSYDPSNGLTSIGDIIATNRGLE